MEGSMQHGDSEVAKIIPFAYQKLPSTKQPSWNSSNIIIFKPIYALEQLPDRRHHARYGLRINKIFSFTNRTWPRTEQPSCCYLNNSSSFELDGHALNSLHGIFQITSSKPFILLSRNLMEGLRQHGDSEIAEIILFKYQRLPSTKQTFWISSTNIFFLTVYPFKQRLGRRLQATWRLRNS